MQTSRTIEHAPELVHLALALVVGCGPELVRRCRFAAGRARILVRTSTVEGALFALMRWRPLVVVMQGQPEDFAPLPLRAIARELGIALLVADDGTPQEELECLLVSGVWEAWLARCP